MATVTIDPQRIAANVRALRAERGWRQRELAEAAVLSLRTIQKVENAEGHAYDWVYGRIAAAVGVSLATVINTKGE